jgi:hypothetical protein
VLSSCRLLKKDSAPCSQFDNLSEAWNLQYMIPCGRVRAYWINLLHPFSEYAEDEVGRFLRNTGTSQQIRRKLFYNSIHCNNIIGYIREMLITVAAKCNAWTVFAHSNTGIVGSNPTRGMDICALLFCLCAVCVDSGIATSWSPVQEILQTVCRLRNWKGA